MASRPVMFVLALAITAVICAPLALLFLADDGQRRQLAAARLQPTLPGAPMRAAARAERPRRKAVFAPRRRSADLSERRLRAFETRVLGPEHAREHAMQRRALRRAENAPQSSAPAAAAVAGDPADIGHWAAPFSIPVMAVHAAMLPTGKVMWFAYPKNPNVRHGGAGPDSPNTAQAWLWDPATRQNTRVDPPLCATPRTVS